VKRYCTHCRRVLSAGSAYHLRRKNGKGAKDIQAACVDCARDRRIIRYYKRMDPSALCALIDRTEEKLRLMALTVRHPDLGASAIVDIYKRGQRHERSRIE